MSEYLIYGFVLLLFSPVIYDFVVLAKRYWRQGEISFAFLGKKLLRIFILLLPFTAVFFILNHINFLNYEKPIPFSEIKRISFENFRGLEFFRESLYGDNRFAYVVTTMECEINEDYVIMESYFHPSRSYVYNSHTNSKDLLTHELYHFKITELFVRKAKERISRITKCSEEEVEHIIEEFRQKERVYQQSYDYDTFHSYVYREQKKYERIVDSLLYSLNEFRSPKVLYKCK